MSQNPDRTFQRLPRMTCSSCGGQLVDKPFCASCGGAGGWGDWLKTGEDTCVTCDGTGQPMEDDPPVINRYCPKCCLIYPTNNQLCRPASVDNTPDLHPPS